MPRCDVPHLPQVTPGANETRIAARAGKELTDDDVTAVFSAVGFEMKAERPCQRRSNVIENPPVRISSGSDGEFEYFFTVLSPSPSNNGLHTPAIVDGTGGPPIW